MLRVGLTGSLGSGKSTVAALLRAHGAQVVEADELGRALMEPGQALFDAIVAAFGPRVVADDGRLDRPALARVVFSDPGRLAELNALVHPAVIAAQQRWMEKLFTRNPQTVAVVESALIFEVERDARARGEAGGALGGWLSRFDRIVLVTAPEECKIARYVARVAAFGLGPEQAEADARRRLAQQIPDTMKAARADHLIDNSSDRAALAAQVDRLWPQLVEAGNLAPNP